MNELNFKKICENDRDKIENLINNVIDNLDRKEFFVPYAQWELDRMFDESYAPLFGCYDKDKLVGMVQLYVDQEFLKEDKEVLDLIDCKVCELGGALILSEYRNKGIVKKLTRMQIELAKDLGFEYIISMVHPDNIYSKKALERLGLKYIKTKKFSNGFLRDIYCMKL